MTARLLLPVALLLALPTAAAAAPSFAGDPGAGARTVRKNRPVFGTMVEILASAPVAEGPGASAPFDAAFDEVARVELLVDEDNPRSAVARINAAAGAAPVAVEPELFALLTEAVRLAKLTKGAFDITAAAYDAAWRFGGDAAPSVDPATGEGDGRAAVPSRKDIDRMRALVGVDDLVLDAAARTAQLKRPGSRIGLRAVARAYALERGAAVLEAAGITSFVVSAGGDLVVRGSKGDQPWMVGLQDPRAAGHFAALPVEDRVVTTTGDYEAFFFDGGVRYHNVIDPRTGQPATKCRSVSVIAKQALVAEALSRAVFVLGARDGVALVERLKDVDVVVVTADNRVVTSRAIKDVVQHRPPTDGP
ncbi:MAG: FAD:protein FMN transferase [Deltaproteobacteria bacterium]|nr:FAD:protein FMN transferase [Deltaproteobacteria bacterium]